MNNDVNIPDFPHILRESDNSELLPSKCYLSPNNGRKVSNGLFLETEYSYPIMNIHSRRRFDSRGMSIN